MPIPMLPTLQKQVNVMTTAHGNEEPEPTATPTLPELYKGAQSALEDVANPVVGKATTVEDSRAEFAVAPTG